MAPVHAALSRDPDLEVRVCVTAQHRDMLDQVLEFYGIRPDYDLNLMRPRQSLTYLAAQALPLLEEVLVAETPDLVLVHGDTLTTFVGTLSAFFQKVPVGHVEAGLRSHDLYSPFPEEANRRLADAITTLHLAPTALARANLLNEGIRPDGIFVTGNTAVDAFLGVLRQDHSFTDPRVAEAFRTPGPVVAAELHRRENWGEPMREVLLGLRDVLESDGTVRAIFSVHPNPSVAELVHHVLDPVPGAVLVDPQPFVEWANVLVRCAVVLSDSGGVQEEAPSAGVRVLLARTETERPEGVEAGTVELVGVSRGRVRNALRRELTRSGRGDATDVARQNPYGDGHAAERIRRAVRFSFGLDRVPPEEFSVSHDVRWAAVPEGGGSVRKTGGDLA